MQTVTLPSWRHRNDEAHLLDRPGWADKTRQDEVIPHLRVRAPIGPPTNYELRNGRVYRWRE